MKKLSVPHISQWDTNASYSKNDCIPVCSAMLVAYYGGNLTPDQISSRIGTQGLVNFDQIRKALDAFGYKLIGETYKTMDDLKKSIDKGIPFIAIVHYGDLPNRQDTYTGGHAVVVTGYDDNNVYVNDPDFWGDRRLEGKSKAYPISSFYTAWQSRADGNNPSNLWYLDAPLPESPLVFQLDGDIPTTIEDKYKLKDTKRYNKHWTYDDLFKDWVKLCSEYEKLQESSKKEALELTERASKLNEQCKSLLEKEKSLELIVEGLKATLEDCERRYKELSLDFDELTKRNRELVEQLAVMSKHAKDAIAEKDIALARLEFLQVSYDDLSLDYKNKEAELEKANNKLKDGLGGYSKIQLLKALFGVY